MFIAIPIVVGVGANLSRPFWITKRERLGDGAICRLWKLVEIFFESGPQMFLQLCIIIWSESHRTADVTR